MDAEKIKNCDFYHPILCKFSQVNKVCTKENCTFTHLRGPRRYALQPETGACQLPLQQQRPAQQHPAATAPAAGVQPQQPQQRYGGVPAPNKRASGPPPQGGAAGAAVGAPQAGADAATNSSFLEKLLEEVKKAFDVRFKEIEKRLPPSAASPAQNETRLVPVNYPSMMPTQFTLQPSSSARQSWC